MASGFSQLYHRVEKNQINSFFDDLVTYFLASGITLTDATDNVEWIGDKNGPTKRPKADLLILAKDLGEVSFFWRISDVGRLYCRIRVVDKFIYI
jgi:hypothetical protein